MSFSEIEIRAAGGKESWCASLLWHPVWLSSYTNENKLQNLWYRTFHFISFHPPLQKTTKTNKTQLSLKQQISWKWFFTASVVVSLIYLPAHVHIHQLSGRWSHLGRTEGRLQGFSCHVPWQHSLREGLWRELGHNWWIISILHLGCFRRHFGSGGQRRQPRLVAGQEEQGGAHFTSCSRATAAGQSPYITIDSSSLRGDGYRGNSKAGEKQEDEGQAKHPSWNCRFHCFITKFLSRCLKKKIPKKK